MNKQFQIQSFEDEVFDLNDIGSNSNSITNVNGILSADKNSAYMHPQLQTEMSSTNKLIASRKRVQSSTLANNSDISDLKEPKKPTSAYALFFRDTVSVIKRENPNCPFQESSHIVASMWDVLDPVHKSDYNKRNEMAWNEYVKQMGIYRQQQLEQQQAMIALQEQKEQTQILIKNNLKCGPQKVLQDTLTSFPIKTYSRKAHVKVNNNGQEHQQHSPSIQRQQQQQLTQYRKSSIATIETPLHQRRPSSVTIANVKISNSTDSAFNTATITSTKLGPIDKQNLNVDSSVQKCENCNNRAIINPDWEDEYCSNECVVEHCRMSLNITLVELDKEYFCLAAWLPDGLPACLPACLPHHDKQCNKYE
uniref:HMG box domain-containing protein n=1 Tax=Glossina brevipalpis TaxID=37001 RepID=A0A1A9WPS0_9MUSC